MRYIFYSILFCTLLSVSCSDSKIVKNSVAQLTSDMNLTKEPSFTVMLHDMEIKNAGFHKEYLHQYRVIRNKDGKPYDKTSKWYHVDSKFFWQHENNLGMEIANKDTTGVLRRVVSPPGYSNYVGNPRYGYWNNSGSRPVWTFFAQYMMLRSLLNLSHGPIYRNSYRDYRNSYNRGFAYYGGRTNYGTRRYGTYSKSRRSSSSYGRRWGRGGGGYGK